MACLGSVLYDPATAATVATSSLLAMTAMDTTNARITFTAPANGDVLVRIRVAEKGATTCPQLLLGVLDGATVRGRQAPIANRALTANANNVRQREAAYLVTGLTPGNSYTWDAAYAVQVVVASSTLGWGGPDNTTGNDAYGALSFEIWDTTNLLAGTMYDPGTAVTSKTTTTASAMTAIDTTNLRLVFTVPASGKVLVRLRCNNFGSAGTVPSVHLGVLQSSTVIGRQISYAFNTESLATAFNVLQSEFVVGGLTPAASLTWDAAFSNEFVAASTKLAYGGPNDATGADAYGGFAFEVWKA